MNITSYHAGPRFGAVSRRSSAAALAGRVHGMLVRQQTRKALAQLDAEQLADIGISRTQALIEAAKPFWIR